MRPLIGAVVLAACASRGAPAQPPGDCNAIVAHLVDMSLDGSSVRADARDVVAAAMIVELMPQCLDDAPTKATESCILAARNRHDVMACDRAARERNER